MVRQKRKTPTTGSLRRLINWLTAQAVVEYDIDLPVEKVTSQLQTMNYKLHVVSLVDCIFTVEMQPLPNGIQFRIQNLINDAGISGTIEPGGEFTLLRATSTMSPRFLSGYVILYLPTLLLTLSLPVMREVGLFLSLMIIIGMVVKRINFIPERDALLTVLDDHIQQMDPKLGVQLRYEHLLEVLGQVEKPKDKVPFDDGETTHPRQGTADE